MKFDHNGVIDLRKQKKFLHNIKHTGAVIFNPYTSSFVNGNEPIKAEIKYVKYLTSDMIKEINIIQNDQGYINTHATLKIELTNLAYLDNLEHYDNYKLSTLTRKLIGVKMFGKMFEKLTKFSNSKDYLNALYNLFGIPQEIPNYLSFDTPMSYVLFFNKIEKSFQIDLNYPLNGDYTNYNVIAYSENVDKLIKLKRVLETLQANTYSAKQVVDIIIKAEKY